MAQACSKPGSQGAWGGTRVLWLHLAPSRGGRQTPPSSLTPHALAEGGKTRRRGPCERTALFPPAGRNSAPASAPRGRGEANPSTGQGPLRGSRGSPPPPRSLPSLPGSRASPRPPPHPNERCQLPDLAPLELPRLWGEVCRALFVSVPALPGPGFPPPLSPDTSKSCLNLRGPEPDSRSSGTWLGERPPLPPPRAAPAPPRLRQPHR